MRSSFAGIALLLALAGCSSLPRHVEKPRSEALANPGSTELGHDVAADESGKNLSGIRLIASGEEAFASLIALADHAQKTLDIQYYIIHEDDSTRTILRHVRLAAERGVRVRVLVDDMNTVGEDKRFLHLSQRANIEVRVFNPFYGGRSATWTRILASINEIARINHRMHNKLFVADNSIAITGGRNLGDAYFTRDSQSNFIDLDVVAAGEIVPGLSASFDAFWNSKYAYPIAAVASSSDPDESRSPVVENAVAADANWLDRELDRHKLDLDWVPATVLADRPAKIASDSDSGEEETIANNIRTLMSSAKQELCIISAYFVPGADGMELFHDLTARGVKVRILTNSLASTDAPLVHIGYARYRKQLLKLGVELYEVRPRPSQPRRRRYRGAGASSNASLHAKALVIDNRTVFIGSMNMDGRSKKFNSELGLVMRSPEIAKQVTGILDDLDADDSFKLSLGKHNKILWTSGEGSDAKEWHSDPETTFSERLLLELLAPFAPEEFL
ncbi:MAG TPA: phospholipase D family protein [Steroidobacteraceae bacterium]|jgi:phosphatidylserine/phosphatidylglycerophosphate/cardiolipin synthase-like enzyme